MEKSDSSPVVLSYSASLADPYSVLSPASILSCVKRWDLSTEADFSDGTEQNKAEYNLTRSQTTDCFDESGWCGFVSTQITSSFIFQWRVIRTGALRPELVDLVLVDCY